jgi:hypothetical protein
MFWAKSGESGQEPAFHPILDHLIDVAAAAEAILEMEVNQIKRFAEHLHVDAIALSTVMIRLVALHDIGKFSRAFQAKRPDLWPLPLGAIEPRAPDIPHTDIARRPIKPLKGNKFPRAGPPCPTRPSLAEVLCAAPRSRPSTRKISDITGETRGPAPSNGRAWSRVRAMSGSSSLDWSKHERKSCIPCRRGAR